MNNKIIKFEVSKDFINALPKRSDFIDTKENTLLKKDIEANREILFMPSDAIDDHIKEDKAIRYKLVLLGVLKDGSKAIIKVHGISPYFDLLIPKNVDPWNFQGMMKALLKERAIYPCKMELKQKYPFVYFQEKESNFLRIYFNSDFARKKAINYFRENTVAFNTNGKEEYIKLETFSNDLSCYYRVVSREYRLCLASWIRIKKYTEDQTGEYAKRRFYTFDVDIHDLENLSESDPRLNEESLIKDRTMSASWDIETDSIYDNTGTAPEANNVVDAKGNEEDVIRMCSIVFYWHWALQPLIIINITDMLSPPVGECLIVLCKNQQEIIKTKALILERMSPEFYDAFNDGFYDWPFINRRAEHYKLVEMMKERISPINMRKTETGYSNIRGITSKRIKLEADQSIVNEYFDVPGTICLDTRTIFRKLYPREQKSSLNHFLALNKLGSKEDMHYKTMHHIFFIVRYLQKRYNAESYDELITHFNKEIDGKEEDYKLFNNDNDSLKNNNNNHNKSHISEIKKQWLASLTIAQILELLEGISKVITYCNTDSRRCQDLLRIRSIITDKREVAKLSFVSLRDSFFNADGVKVRNLVLAEGMKPEWNMVFNNIPQDKKDSRKYPGAYVVPPKKGLYRDHLSMKTKRKEELMQKIRDWELKNYMCNDISDKIDRPCAGLDFSSLYPSLIMTYNFSPEKLIVDETYKEYLQQRKDKYGKNYEFVEVDFKYGFKDQDEESKEQIHGWFIQHHPVYEDENNNENTNNENKVNNENTNNENKVNNKVNNNENKVNNKVNTGKILRNIVALEGFGLYPTILKELFDKRAGIKKKKEIYDDVKEFLGRVLKSLKQIIIESKNQSNTNTGNVEESQKIKEEKEYIKNVISSEMEKRKLDLEKAKKSQKKYFGEKLETMKKIGDFMEKTWYNTEDSVDDIYAEVCFQSNYLSSKEKALKVFMNCFYGLTGDQLSPFFVPHVAGGITTYGQKNIKMVKIYVEEQGFDVKYGDSVTADTPILCKRKDQSFTYKTIDEIAHNWVEIDYGTDKNGNHITKEHADTDEPLQIWSSDGWTDIKKVIRHKTNKDIYRINTHIGCVDVTEDHSLLDENGNKIRPTECKTGTKLLHRNLPTSIRNNPYYNLISSEEAWIMGLNNRGEKIPDEILNAREEVKESFINAYYTHTDNYETQNKGKLYSAALDYLESKVIYENDKHSCLNEIWLIEKLTKLNSELNPELTKLNSESYVYDLETENHTFAAGIGKLIVHNTDSLYISPPEHDFAEVDKLFEEGKITKLEYWTQMIEISMEVLDNISLDVAVFLFKDNGTRFLKMSYEEILWPYAFVGKKKYLGIQHQKIVNLDICMPGCLLQEFIDSKSLFLRGLEVVKRGSSEFLKLVCFSIMKEMFCITAEKTLKEIVETSLQEITKKDWNPSFFLKSGKYKLPSADKPGNKPILEFVKRMQDIERRYPQLEIKPPELGERFNYVLAKKYPWIYDMHGRKKKIGAGDKYEFFESLNNTGYLEIVGNLEIDLDHYVTNEVIGQLSRFIIYHPEYDKFFDESMYEDDEEYKEADKKAHDYAKKELQELYKENFAHHWEEKGDQYKEVYKTVSEKALSSLKEKYDSATLLFKLDVDYHMNIENQGNQIHANNKLREDFKNLAKKKADKLACVEIDSSQNAFTLFKIYVSTKDSILKVREKMLSESLAAEEMKLSKLIPSFQKILIDYNSSLESVIMTNRDDSLDDLEFEFSVPEESEEILDEIYNCFISFIAVYKGLKEKELIKDRIEYLKAKAKNNVYSMKTISEQKKLKQDFMEWLNEQKEL